MAASPVDLTSDMQAIEAHWQEGQRLHGAGVFTDEEWSQHQAISYTGLIVLGLDGMKRLAETLLHPRRAMTYTEMMNNGVQNFS